jgi:hypothetical protein
MREVLALAAHFPYALVGLAPDALQMVEQRDLQAPARFRLRQATLTSLMQ